MGFCPKFPAFLFRKCFNYYCKSVMIHRKGWRCESSRGLSSSHLISSHLISSHLISSHLISSHLISSHLHQRRLFKTQERPAFAYAGSIKTNPMRLPVGTDVCLPHVFRPLSSATAIAQQIRNPTGYTAVQNQSRGRFIE